MKRTFSIRNHKKGTRAMKRNLYLVIILVLLLNPVLVFATASVCTVNPPEQRGSMFSQLITWTGSSSDGNFTQCNLVYPVNGILTHIETDPGSTQPSATYYPRLTDQMGLQITTAARSQTATEITKPTVSGSQQAVPVWGKLLLDIISNSVQSANGKIRLFWFVAE